MRIKNGLCHRRLHHRGGLKMKCEEKVGEYCRQAVKYEKYGEYRKCIKCCIECGDPCGNMCDVAIKINKERAYK